LAEREGKKKRNGLTIRTVTFSHGRVKTLAGGDFSRSAAPLDERLFILKRLLLPSVKILRSADLFWILYRPCFHRLQQKPLGAPHNASQQAVRRSGDELPCKLPRVRDTPSAPAHGRCGPHAPAPSRLDLRGAHPGTLHSSVNAGSHSCQARRPPVLAGYRR